MTRSHPASLEARLLADLQADVAVHDAARARVRERLSLSLALLPSIDPDPASGSAHAATAVRAGAVRAWTWLAVGFVSGGVAGAVAHAELATPETRTVYVDRVPRLAAAAPLPPPPAPAAVTEPQAPPSVASVVGARSPLAPASSEKAAELGLQIALLDRAREAFSSGDFKRSLELLREHSRRFPSSVLEQEREVLAIKALVRAGNRAEAQVRGQRFEARFPNSMLSDSVKKALGTNP